MPGGPTDHLANERTYLAWVRTAITIMGLGFVVAKFGIFLRTLAGTGQGTSSPVSEGVGVLLILSGAALVALAWMRFRRVQAGLERETYAPHNELELALTGVLLVVGVALALYLVLAP